MAYGALPETGRLLKMNVLLRRIAVISFLVALAVFGVACSDDNEGGGDITPENAVVSAEDPDDPSALTCADGLSAVDLPLGSRQDIDGTSFELNEKMTTVPEYSSRVPVQESVTLKVNLVAGMSLPAVVIHAADDSTYSHPEDDQLVLGLSPGGTGSYTIITSAYVSYQDSFEDRVTDLTLCLDYSNSQPQDK